MKALIVLGLCVGFSACAASNGGGWVVGNSLVGKDKEETGTANDSKQKCACADELAKKKDEAKGCEINSKGSKKANCTSASELKKLEEKCSCAK